MFRELLPLVVAALVPFVVLTVIIAGTAVNLVAWQPPILQTMRFGTANSTNAITAIASDQTGTYAAGFVGFSPGSGNVSLSYLFVSKYDANNLQVWNQHLYYPFGSLMYGLGVGTDGVYVVGHLFSASSNQTAFVRKYDLNGNGIWSDQFGSSYTSGTSVSVTATSVYVGGYNGTQHFLKNYDSNGTLIWIRFFGNGNGSMYVNSGPDGVYATGGTQIEKYAFNGTLQWTRTCSCDAGGITGYSTSVYVVGTVPTATGLQDGFLAKYDSSGDLIWTRIFSAPGFNSVGAVDASADSSGVYLSISTSDVRGVVMKYDNNGNKVWSLMLPWETGSPVSPLNVISLTQNGLYLGGTDANDDDAFIAQVAASSSLIFFGANPPLSFGIVGVLVAVSVVSVLWLRRQWAKKHRPSSVASVYRSQKLPTDVRG